MFKLINLILLSLLLSVSAGAEIKVGAVFPMTGAIATYGQESVNGINLALQKINTDDQAKIKLILEDNKGEPIESANAVKKLINVDKVHVVLGSVASSNTLAGAPIAQEFKVPLLTPASTNVDVTKKGDFIARTCFTDDFQGGMIAKFANTKLNAKTAAIVLDNSSDYSKGIAKVFRQEFTKMGGKIVDGTFSYVQKDTDFRSLIRKIKRAKPDVIVLPGYYTEVGLFLKQARELGVETPVVGGDGWDSPKLQSLAGAGIRNSFLTTHFAPDDKDPAVQNFVKEYQKKYKQKPGAMAALGYDGIMVLADAIKRANSNDRTAIRDAIVATKGFKGVTGMITIDGERNAQKSIVVLEATPKGNVYKDKINPN